MLVLLEKENVKLLWSHLLRGELTVCTCIVNLVFKKNEGPEKRPDERWMGANLNNLLKETIGLTPSTHPNPRILGEVWSSYGGATPTHDSPRDNQEQSRKQTRKNNTRNNTV